MGEIDPKAWKNFQSSLNNSLGFGKKKSPEEEEAERQKKIKEDTLKAMYRGVHPTKSNP